MVQAARRAVAARVGYLHVHPEEAEEAVGAVTEPMEAADITWEPP